MLPQIINHYCFKKSKIFTWLNNKLVSPYINWILRLSRLYLNFIVYALQRSYSTYHYVIISNVGWYIFKFTFILEFIYPLLVENDGHGFINKDIRGGNNHHLHCMQSLCIVFNLPTLIFLLSSLIFDIRYVIGFYNCQCNNTLLLLVTYESICFALEIIPIMSQNVIR